VGLLVPIALLALGGAAAGSTGSVAAAITTRPITVGRGYRLTLRVDLTQPNAPRLAVRLARQSGQAIESHWWPFPLRRGDLSCSGGYVRCSLDTHNDLRGYGRVRLRFMATGAAKGIAPPAGCTGTSTVRNADVKGAFAFYSHNGFFGVLRRVSHSAVTRTSSLDCARRALACHRTELAWTAHQASFALVSLNRGGRASVSFRISPWALNEIAYHEIRDASLPRGSWTAAGDLSTATFRSNDVPFLSGDLHYRASTPPGTTRSKCGVASTTSGRVTGNLAPEWNGYPRVAYPGGGQDATLIREP